MMNVENCFIDTDKRCVNAGRPASLGYVGGQEDEGD